MIITWEDGKPSAWVYVFGGASTVQSLAEHFLGVFGPEIEGEATLRTLRLPGDFVARPESTKGQYEAALEKIVTEETGSKVTFTFRQVERPVVVLRGSWNFTPATPTSDRRRQVEIYGQDLNRDMNRGGGASGSVAALAGWVSRSIDRQVIIEATDPPERVSWHVNDLGDETSESRAKAHDPDLVIKHLEEQSGLKASRETRQVRRLFIESAPTP